MPKISQENIFEHLLYRTPPAAASAYCSKFNIYIKIYSDLYFISQISSDIT